MIAIILGGSEEGEEEARRFTGEEYFGSVTWFLINDRIATHPYEAQHGVTLHPAKLRIWLSQRAAFNFPSIPRVWSHRNAFMGAQGITDTIDDWQGSSSLLAVHAARFLGFSKIVLCGVPVDPGANHFIRHKRWMACQSFRRGWTRHHKEIAPYVRSMSGWTRDNLGAPTQDWLLGD